MLKTSRSTESITRPVKGVVGVGSDNKAGCDRNELDRSEIEDIEIDNGKIDDEAGKKGQKTSKFKNLFKFKILSKTKKTLGSDFFTSGARLALTELRQEFIKILILY